MTPNVRHGKNEINWFEAENAKHASITCTFMMIHGKNIKRKSDANVSYVDELLEI